jgi:hypothetical protein
MTRAFIIPCVLMITAPAWADGFPIAPVIPLPAPPLFSSGAVLLCNPFGCRSSPYIPPPPVYVPPLVIYSPQPTQPPGPRPFYRPAPGQPGPPVAAIPPPAMPAPPPGAAAPAPPPGLPHQDQQEIEASILDFCDAHPDESFCTKLGAYLRAHPQTRTPR